MEDTDEVDAMATIMVVGGINLIVTGRREEEIGKTIS